METVKLSLAIVGSLFLLGLLAFVICFGPSTYRFLRDDPDFRVYLHAKFQRILRRLPTWQEVLIMAVIYALGYLAFHFINASY
ncbi:hypothetical protein [Spirosoma foliorum]|uniref:Uncharacterized protein n=1 Tax=Spirosoma foliorum TaxID=2710596 RepID=A0A7G5H5D4_9BACT|nr:hypothetical protein [Spirosoma foliorum]QMW06326.1 hypothetical protein H3H32_16270 [Spirosoma foliorum]